MAISIPITDANRDRIQASLDCTQKRCTARLQTVSGVFSYASEAEQMLANLGVPKDARRGASAVIQPPAVANSYNYSAQGTYVHLKRNTRGWCYTGAHRNYSDKCSGGRGERLTVSLPETPDLLKRIARHHGVSIFTPRTEGE